MDAEERAALLNVTGERLAARGEEYARLGKEAWVVERSTRGRCTFAPVSPRFPTWLYVGELLAEFNDILSALSFLPFQPNHYCSP